MAKKTLIKFERFPFRALTGEPVYILTMSTARFFGLVREEEKARIEAPAYTDQAKIDEYLSKLIIEEKATTPRKIEAALWRQ